MSNSKKLSYEMEEPAFLRRMRQAAVGGGHQERYIAPRNRKAPVDDDEDAPAYVLEESNHTLTKEEFEAMERGEGETGEKPEGEEGGEGKASAEGGETSGVDGAKKTEGVEKVEENARSKVAEVGGKKKRKAAKIVGGEDEIDGMKKADGKKQEPEKKEGKRITGKKPKQRIKLSFNEDE